MFTSRKRLATTLLCTLFIASGCLGPEPGGYSSTLEDAPEPEEKSDAKPKKAGLLSRLAENCPSRDVIDYAKKGDLEAFAECLRAGNDPWIVAAPSRRNPSGWELPGYSALFWAARNGHLDIVELLVDDYGVSPDWGGSFHAVPVVAAIKDGGIRVARYLLEQGADTRRWDASGETALIAATMQRDLEDLEAVIAAGAYPNEINGHFAQTALSAAMTTRKWGHARLLVEAGACVGSSTAKLEKRLANMRPDDRDRFDLEGLIDAIRFNYDPNCQVASTGEGEYEWQLERGVGEVEVAEREE